MILSIAREEVHFYLSVADLINALPKDVPATATLRCVVARRPAPEKNAVEDAGVRRRRAPAGVFSQGRGHLRVLLRQGDRDRAEVHGSAVPPGARP